MNNFDYQKPVNLKDALFLKEKWGKSSSLLLGGTDLLLAIENGTNNPEFLIDLKGVGELDSIEETSNAVTIGAGVTFSTLINSQIIRKQLPGLWEASRLVASPGVRNVATLTGNICNAVPSAESAAPLLVRDARIEIASVKGKKDVLISDFFTGPRKTVVKENEIVTSITIPAIKSDFGESYVKLGRYRGEDIAQVGVSVLVDKKLNYKIAFAAVGPVPLRIPKAELLMKGKEISPELIMEAQDIIVESVSPITDIRASREYRIHMCRIMFEKAVTAAVSRMKSSKPEYGTRLI